MIEHAMLESASEVHKPMNASRNRSRCTTYGTLVARQWDFEIVLHRVCSFQDVVCKLKKNGPAWGAERIPCTNTQTTIATRMGYLRSKASQETSVCLWWSQRSLINLPRRSNDTRLQEGRLAHCLLTSLSLKNQKKMPNLVLPKPALHCI